MLTSIINPWQRGQYMAPPYELVRLRYSTLLNVAFQIRQAYTESEVLRWNQYHHASAIRAHGLSMSGLLPGN